MPVFKYIRLLSYSLIGIFIWGCSNLTESPGTPSIVQHEVGRSKSDPNDSSNQVSIIILEEKPTPTEESDVQLDASGNPIPAEAMEEYAAAVGALQSGEQGRANLVFQELIRKHPSLAGPHVNLALIALQDNAEEIADYHASQALVLNPKNVEALLIRGLLAKRKGEFSKAIASYEQALAINPDDPKLHLNLGIVYDLYVGELSKALQHYQRYQTLSKAPEEKVGYWIIDLQARIQ